MLKPLPFQEPERIVELYSSARKAGLDHMPANVPFYLDYSKNATSYESLGLWTFFYGLVGEKDSVVRIPGVRMTAEIFNILRITARDRHLLHEGAEHGRAPTRSSCSRSPTGRRSIGESPEVLGKEVRIDDEAYKVIGVAPRVLEAFDARMKFVVPLSWPRPRRIRRAATAWASSCSDASSRASRPARRTPRPRSWRSATSTPGRRR